MDGWTKFDPEWGAACSPAVEGGSGMNQPADAKPGWGGEPHEPKSLAS